MNEQQIFAEARRRNSTERTKFLDKQCAGDERLQRRVERLLRLDNSHSNFFERKPASILSDMTGGVDDNSKCTGEELVERVLQALEPTENEANLGQLAHYEIREVIGHGGFGVVLRAVDQKLKRPVAIKVLSPELASTAEHRGRFLTEARSAAAVRHENVVQIYAVEESPFPFIVMELIEGCTLQSHLTDVGPLPAEEILTLAAQIAGGLGAAHGTGIVHRDIKPGNILLEHRDVPRIKLTDFGLAHPVDDPEIPIGTALLGTPAYMAPEQARGAAVDHRSDLFSFGSVIYAMCCGRKAFSDSNTVALLKNVEKVQPRPLGEQVENLPLQLIAIVDKLHQKEPALRYQSAKDIGLDLQKLIAINRRRRSRSLPKWAQISIAVAAVSILFITLAVTQETPPPEQAQAVQPLIQADSSPAESEASVTALVENDAEQQVYDVIAEMTKRNPGFDPRLLDYEITDNRVTFFKCVQAPDFSPLAALTDLERIHLYVLVGTIEKTDLSFVSGMKNLKDLKTDGVPLLNLEPLNGLSLTRLSMWCWNWQGKSSDGDLSPLDGIPLTHLNAGGAHIQTLEPLRGAPLVDLCLNTSNITDLSPLEDMSTLRVLTVANTGVEDLTPLANLKLRELEIGETNVRDISPLANVPIQILSILDLQIDDLSPLKNMPLVSLRMDYHPFWDRALLEQLPHVQQLNGRSIEYYKRPEIVFEGLLAYAKDTAQQLVQFAKEHFWH